MSDEKEPRPIPRPDVTTAQIVLLIVGGRGKMTFQEIVSHPTATLLGVGRTTNSFYTALARLKRRKRIIRTGHHYELTSAGHYAMLKAFARKELVQHEKKLQVASHKIKSRPWDGKWRIVFFDVPESKRALRDYARSMLKRIGFIEFQRSIWVWPHVVPSFLVQLFNDPTFRPHTKIITTYDIDYDIDLRKRFKLSI